MKRSKAEYHEDSAVSNLQFFLIEIKTAPTMIGPSFQLFTIGNTLHDTRI